MKHIIIKLFLFSCVSIAAQEAEIEENKPEPDGSTGIPIAFNLGPHSFSSAYSLYASASTSGAQDYTIFTIDQFSTRPLAKKEVTLNHKKEQENPFYDKKITHLYTIYNNPLLITDDRPSDIYYAAQPGNLQDPTSLLSIHDLQDANGLISDGIITIGFYQTVTEERQHTYLICPVKKHNGNFGDDGSGFALVKFESIEVAAEEDEKNNESEANESQEISDELIAQKVKKIFLMPLDAQEGIIDGNKAFPLDVNPTEKELVQINGGLDYIQSNAADIFFDENFSRFYVALQVKTKDNANSNQGACALLVGYVWQDKLHLDPIVPSSVFSSDKNNIIGAVGPDRYVSLHKVTTMHSTSGLPYLIVVGGNGRPEETNKTVYAFPLANRSNSSNSLEQRTMDKGHGGIAKKELLPEYQFFPGRFGRLKSRVLDETAIDENDFYSDCQSEVRVGGETQLPNAIKKIVAARDMVIALVDQDGDSKEAGVFYSQAIFNEHGRIAAWSSWQKVPGSSPSVIDFSIDPNSFNFTFFETLNQLTIRSCRWSYIANDQNKQGSEKKSLSYILQEELPQSIGGIQGLIDFNYSWFGISGNQKNSLLVATGNKQVVLVQTASDDENGILRARNDFSNAMKNLEGTLSNIKPGEQSVLSISGGVLEQLGPITCATIINDEQQAWLAVGGVRGIALLADKDGNGWPLQEGIGNNFSNFSSAFYFQKLGDYQFIQKLIGLDNYLYILTEDKLEYRIVCPEMLHRIDESKTLITKTELGGYFNDVLISRGCALLATGCGLFFGGEDNTNNPGKISWKKIDLPGSSQAIPKLFCVTPTGNESDFFNKSQIFVLSGSVAQAEAEVYRLFIGNGKIELVKDYAYKDNPSRFISFGAFRDNFATDGLIHLSTRTSGWPLAHVLPAFIGGKLIASSKGYVVPINTDNTENFNVKISSIRQIVKSSATGSWLIGGDFGICTHE